MTNEAHCLLVRPLMEYLSPVHAVQQCQTRLPALYFVLDSKAQAGCYDMTMILTSRYLSPNDCKIVVKHGHHAHSSHFMLEIRPLASDTVKKVVRCTDEIGIDIGSTQNSKVCSSSRHDFPWPVGHDSSKINLE